MLALETFGRYQPNILLNIIIPIQSCRNRLTNKLTDTLTDKLTKILLSFWEGILRDEKVKINAL